MKEPVTRTRAWVKALCLVCLFALLLPAFCLPLNADDESAPVAAAEPEEDTSVENAPAPRSFIPLDNICLNAYLVPLQTPELRKKLFKICQSCEIDILSHVYLEPHYVDQNHDVTHYAPVMEEAEQYGLKVQARDYIASISPYMSDQQILDMVNAYKDLPGFGGIYVIDEPYNPNIYAHCENVLRTVIPDQYINVNFLPNCMYSEGTYVRRLADYGSLLKLGGSLSTDTYCFGPEGGVYEQELFSNYESLREAGLRTNTNTAVYVQSVELFGLYRTPSEADLRYNMMAALAYGIKEIKFFTFGTSPSGAYADAVVSMAYEPTERLDYLRRINPKVHAIGKVLAKCDALQVYHTGTSMKGVYEKLPKDTFITFSGRPDFILSMMQERDGDGEYIMLVNKSLKKEKTFSFTLNGPTGIRLVSEKDGSLSDVEPVNGEYTFTLAPGDGMVFQILGGDFITPHIYDEVNIARNAAFKSTSSTGENDHYTYNLFDGKTDGWSATLTAGDDGHMDQAITLDFGKLTDVNRVDLYPSGEGVECGRNFPKHVTITVSKDGEHWTKVADADASVLFTNRSQVPVISFDDARCRWLRITFKDFDHAGQYCELNEICAYNDPHDGSIPDVIPTSYKAPEVQTNVNIALNKPVFALSSIADGIDRNTMFGMTGSGWVSAPQKSADSAQSVTIDLLDLYTIDRVSAIAPDSGALFPTNYEIQLSLDGVHFTTVVSEQDTSYAPGEIVTKSIEPTLARYIRFSATGLAGTNGQTSGFTAGIRSLQCYGKWIAQETKPIPHIEFEQEPDPVIEPETDSETTPETDPETTPETTPETQPATQADTTPVTQPETDPAVTEQPTAPAGTDETDAPDEPASGCKSVVSCAAVLLLAAAAAVLGLKRRH